jgi:hypothetical protein
MRARSIERDVERFLLSHLRMGVEALDPLLPRGEFYTLRTFLRINVLLNI